MSKLHDLIYERFPFILVFMFVLSSMAAFALQPDRYKIIDATIDIFGILIGFISVFLILNISKSFKGHLRTAFNYIISGISFQVLALVDDALKDFKVYLYPEDIHLHFFLMIIGIILFTVSAFKLKNMLSELK